MDPVRRKCGTEKPLTDFHVDNSRADKRSRQCKTCRLANEKEKLAKKRRILIPTVAEKTCRREFASSHPAVPQMLDARACWSRT